MEIYINIAYLVAAVCFIYGLKMLSHPRTARNGNLISSFGMLLAIIATVGLNGTEVNGVALQLNWMLIGIALFLGSIIGAFFATKVEMTQMPQLVAIFNGFGGAASALVACSEFLKISDGGAFTLIAISLSLIDRETIFKNIAQDLLQNR